MIEDIEVSHITEVYHPVEYVNTLKWLFITITLKPKLYKYSSVTQFELTRLDVESIFLSSNVKADFSVELTEQGNVHYHAVICSPDKFKAIHAINKFKRNRAFGHIHIKPIGSQQEYERAINYIQKDIEGTKKILHTSNFKPEIYKTIN